VSASKQAKTSIFGLRINARRNICENGEGEDKDKDNGRNKDKDKDKDRAKDKKERLKENNKSEPKKRI
jgi:hypothetical protein